MWSDERDLIMDLLDESNKLFPQECPCCKKNGGHVFFYKNREDASLGSAWAWCSNCKEYSHSRTIIPEWWKNMPGITLEQLHSCPDNLDDMKDVIDAWVNSIKP